MMQRTDRLIAPGSSEAARLHREGKHELALAAYCRLKQMTGLGAWDWQIRELERLLDCPRTVFLPQELGRILKRTAGFERIYVANLRHRSDRRRRVIAELLRFGISLDDVQFVEGVHGAQSEEARQRLERFRSVDPATQMSIASVPPDILAFDRAHASPGTIGYLMTQDLILRDALAKKYERILVLDDDIFFTARASELAFRFFSQVSGWKLVHLGASEHSPPDSAILMQQLQQAELTGHYFPIPYWTCGSYAVGYDAALLGTLRDLVQEFAGVFDRHILAHLYGLYPGKCFVLRPAASCADVSESDIREGRDMNGHAQRMGWDISRYAAYQATGTSGS